MADYGRPRVAGGRAAAPVLRAQNPPTLALGHSATPLADTPSTTEIRGGFITQLLAALNIRPDAWERVSGNAHVAAIAANEAFNRARRSNASLDALLRKREDDARLSFDEAYTALKGKLRPQAAWDQQMLDDAYQELDQHWAVLMLLPNGPYESVLRDLVDNLEADAGAGRLSNEQQALYDISRALALAFHGNARADEASWRRLVAGFTAAQHAETRVAGDNGRQLMN
jgi:hypothetical protein